MNLRADAARNKQRLIAAAEIIFAQHGAEAPLQLIAERAGLGRGTLYRHFPDREALVFAVFEARVIDFETVDNADSSNPLLAEQILISMLDTQARTPGLVSTILATGKYTGELDGLTDRILESLKLPLRSAQAGGRIFEDVTGRDFLLAWSMFGWVSSNPSQVYRGAQTARTRTLLLRSILTPTALADYLTQD